MFVQREIGYDPFQLAVLFAQLPEFPQLGQSQSGVSPLPTVKRLLPHPHLSTNFADLLACFDLPQGIKDLLFAVAFPWHLSSFASAQRTISSSLFSTSKLSRFWVLGQHYLKGEIGRKAVVIVALSGDSGSESSLADALETLLASDVIAYVLQIYDGSKHDKCDVLHIFGKDSSGEAVLKKLAEATGGRMLEVRGIDKLHAALDEISDELHHQYSLGYYPENKNWDGKFRKIQISAGGKDYKVYARKGYYANRPEANVAESR